jgi:hypothetical protein
MSRQSPARLWDSLVCDSGRDALVFAHWLSAASGLGGRPCEFWEPPMYTPETFAGIDVGAVGPGVLAFLNVPEWMMPLAPPAHAPWRTADYYAPVVVFKSRGTERRFERGNSTGGPTGHAVLIADINKDAEGKLVVRARDSNTKQFFDVPFEKIMSCNPRPSICFGSAATPVFHLPDQVEFIPRHCEVFEAMDLSDAANFGSASEDEDEYLADSATLSALDSFVPDP